MALLERVSTLIRANLNDLIDQAEDPEKMIKQVILDMQNQLFQAQKMEIIGTLARMHLKPMKTNADAAEQPAVKRHDDLLSSL